jgi:hypothetical protein
LPLLAQNQNVWVGELAIYPNLTKSLEEKPQEPLWVMTHGNSDCFYDQDDKPTFDLDNAHLLATRKNFVYACYTANELGRKVAQQGGVYLGYTGQLHLPNEITTTVADVFRPIFQFIQTNFPVIDNEEQASHFLQKLKNLCDNALYDIDELAENEPDTDVLSLYQSIGDFWGRLWIWLPFEEKPISHNEGAQSPLFEKKY